MRTKNATSFYRHTGVALLRSAVAPLTSAPDRWPDPADEEGCRSWLGTMWSRAPLNMAIRLASSGLAARMDAVCSGRVGDARQIRRATLTIARYTLRATSRPTPFGLFAGVAPVTFDHATQVRWGADHRPVVRPDTQWLSGVIDRLETCPELLERLDVMFNNLAVPRGERLEAPHGPNRVRIRYTRAVEAVRAWAALPVPVAALTDRLVSAFDGADRSTALDMLTELVRQRLLLTCMRAPSTIVDPLSHLVERLEHAGACTLPGAEPMLHHLNAVEAELRRHNEPGSVTGPEALDALKGSMRELSSSGRTPLAVDLVLDCSVRLPEHVVREAERAAGALLRLSRHPAGSPVWQRYHALFCDRYGTGTLVPLTHAVDPDAGLGYPAGYPGSVLPSPPDVPSERDQRLLALAWQAIVDGSGEIALTDQCLRHLAGDEALDDRYIPPHVEVAVRVHAATARALDRGEYVLTIAPARSGGVLTSRFTPTATGSGLEEVYRELPVVSEGALAVQMSFPPAYPHAENISRVPVYLQDILSLGEHRVSDTGATTIPLDDLAITATRDRLYLVSRSRRRVLEPQVFHALALEKQAPPLARFLAHLPRAFTASWTAFDWGPHADRLPYLPRVRFRRSILTPARWRLTGDDLPPVAAEQETWHRALGRWRNRWACPCTVDLRDHDRTLRLTLEEPIHAMILRAHLVRNGHAILTEVTAEFGWLDDHAHEIVLPLVATRSTAPSPLAGSLPVVTNQEHGWLPGESDATWLSAKLYSHPERHDELIADHLQALLAALGSDVAWWFVRYRGPHETDHLRLRLRVAERGRYGACAAEIGDWARSLRRKGLAGPLVLESYQPEVGRYGHGPALDAAEAVFVADSRAVAVGLRHLRAATIHPTALAAVIMAGIVSDFLGCDEAMAWLASRPVLPGPAVGRTVADQAVRLAQPGAFHDLLRPPEVADAWQTRSDTLAAYRSRLPAEADVDVVIESLLHMHHNRAIGIDQDSERTCRRLARHAARAWQARQAGSGRR